MNQMDKQNRIDGLREAVESGDLERAYECTSAQSPCEGFGQV